MPSEKEKKAAVLAACEVIDCRPSIAVHAAVAAALSAAEKEREGETLARECPATGKRCGFSSDREGLGRCKCGPVEVRERDTIEELREWVENHSTFSNADGLTVLVEVEPLLTFLNDLQEQSTPEGERGDA